MYKRRNIKRNEYFKQFLDNYILSFNFRFLMILSSLSYLVFTVMSTITVIAYLVVEQFMLILTFDDCDILFIYYLLQFIAHYNRSQRM